MTMHGSTIAADSFTAKLTAGLQHPRPDIAEHCAWILGEQKEQYAVPALCQTIQERLWDIDVAAAAVAALGKIGDPHALPALLFALQHGAARVRAEVIAALRQLDAPQADAVLHNIAEHDPLASIRDQALRALQKGR